MKKILILGGAGFIGSHLCRRAIDNNFKVVCMDNLSSGSINNISNIQSNNFEFVKMDICNEFDFNNDFDYILNFACPASPKYYLDKPLETAFASTIGLINILNFTKKNKKSILLHSSTSEVYGDPLCHPQSEDYFGNVNTVGPRSCYDESKRVAETFIYEYVSNYNINAKIIRIFNTYGPNMAADDGRVVSNFINQALNNEDITIYGDGSQTRSFCYIEDLIDGIFNYLLLEEKFMGPMNLGNPIEMKVKDLAEKVIKLTNSKSKIIYLDMPQDDPKLRQPNIKLAKDKINFSPQHSIKKGLLLTIDYFSN
ncbi:MAG: GDP-mannose 4,6-dehydratase [Candidatus Marinimicrobia bacterium]|nr:GDP-mannose 4,6-dehydratase [Candidatus Neomarinimicrobiota bacterium]